MRKAVLLGYLIGSLCAAALCAQEIQGYGDDPDFKPRVERPAYPKDGPKVLFHRQRGAHRSHEPLLKLLRADGYRVSESDGTLDLGTLRKFAVLVWTRVE